MCGHSLRHLATDMTLGWSIRCLPFCFPLIPQLQPNSTDVAMDVLIRISQQLSNSTTPAFELAAFQVSSNAVVVNMLFFLSLALVLIDAFLAMLVKGWLQEFDRGWRKYTVAHLRAQERERRLLELERWKLHELVALLPILIQGSLLLFCIGILVFIFPLHLPSAILCSLLFLSVVGFYGFTTYASIVNNYAPFSSPLSRILARGLAMLQTRHIPITQNAQRIISAILFHNLPPSSQGQQADADSSDETKRPFPSNDGVATIGQPHSHNGVEKSNKIPRSRSAIDPQTHVLVLERLVATTTEAVENIPIFLELLDQPMKDATLRPFNVEKWKELLHITWRLLREQSTFSVSSAWTLARTTMICYNHTTAHEQLSRILQQHLGSRETDNQNPRMPLHVLFSSYLRFRLGYLRSYYLWRTIAFLEPSDAADAELLWMVNTSHWILHSKDDFQKHIAGTLEGRLGIYLEFSAAVLTYISSTEQSRRSKAPLTAAVIYALRTIRSALDQGDINSIEGLYIQPGAIPPSEAVLMTFCRVDGIDTLDLWSEECIQIVKDLLQWDHPSYLLNDFRLSLIAALYIDSTKHAHARSTFEDVLEHISIKNVFFQFSDAYDHGKLAVYLYMAVTGDPLEEGHDPLAAPYVVIENTITKRSGLQLFRLHILEIAVKHVHKTAYTSPDWLQKTSFDLSIEFSNSSTIFPLEMIDPWVLLHLDTLLAPKSYLLPEEMEKLEWSDTPKKVHIAKARLDLYDSLADIGHGAGKGPKPHPGLLRVFLWSKNNGVCIRAFKWYLDLLPISESDTPGELNSAKMFTPGPMGYAWVGHLIQVLCEVHFWQRAKSWSILISGLVPKWTMLSPSWCRNFASEFMLCNVLSPGMDGLPAYQCFAEAHRDMSLDERQAFLPFLATLLELIKSSLNWSSLTSLENWLARLPEALENQGARTQVEHILAIRKRQFEEENLGFFAELPMAGEWLEQTVGLFAELPMADE